MYVEDISSRCVAARSFIFVWHCLENVLNSTILDTVQRTNWFLGSELDIESWEIAISCCFQLPSCDSFPLIIFRFGFPFQLLMLRLLFFPPNSLNLGAFFLLLWSHNCTWGTWRNKFQMIRGSDWKLSADPYPYLHNPPIRDCVS